MEAADIPESVLKELFEAEELARAGIARKPPAKVVAGVVKLARGIHGWKQQTLASMANVSLSTIERIERGEPVNADSLNRVALALGYKEGDFTDERVPLTSEQCLELGKRCAEPFRDTISVSVNPLRTQPQVRLLAEAHMYLIDGGRLGDDYAEELSALAEWLDLVSFILTSEERGSIFQRNRSERAKRRELYAHVLNAVRTIESLSSSIALAGTYQAATGANVMPTAKVALIGFFPKSSDPAAIKRRVLFAPAKVDLADAWRRFCAEA
jgi:transcriptional regulator with XRE-family HTH domain